MADEILNLVAVWVACGRCGKAQRWHLAGSGQNGIGVGFIHFFNSMPVQKDPAVLATRKTPLILCQACRGQPEADALLLPSSRAKIHVCCMRCGFASKMDAADYRTVFFDAASKAPDPVTGMRNPPMIACNACSPKFSTWGRAKDDTEIQG